MKKKQSKFIFIIGGVMSGVGKGVASSSIGVILQSKGYKVTALKIDPYINVDAGTMNPTEHGEVFVLSDGDETDQDMGNYERFLNLDLTSTHYMTTGRVYKEVINKERNLGFKGKNVEVVPDIPKEVIRRIRLAAERDKAEIVIVEIGGTVGEYQNVIFVEAGRMMKLENPEDVYFVMVSYLPIPPKVGEMKTKPTQHAARTLNSIGVQANMIIARSEMPLDRKRKEKIATFCNVRADHVISAPDVESIYDIPINFEKDKLGEIICKNLKLKPKKNPSGLREWKKFVHKTKSAKKEIKIAIVGKYFNSGDFVLSDSYLSVIEAIKFSAFYQNRKAVIDYINADQFSNQRGVLTKKGKEELKKLRKYDGIIIPGGFGSRGIEGKIQVIKYAREKGIPFFGLCYGMQLAIVEYARNELGLKKATTVEINPKAKIKVIDTIPDQKKILKEHRYGGTMRLGSYPAIIKKGTIAYKAYGKNQIKERHRHRFEVNPEYLDFLSSKELIFSGMSPDGKLAEIAELPKKIHPFFVGVQFHPEFQAKPIKPHPLFDEFVKALIKRKN